jgi:endo-1,4-beta-xylanase
MKVETSIVWSSLGAVLLLAGAIPSARAAVLDDAAQNIERYRKGDAVVEVQDTDGRPVGGASVEVRQVSHDFPFGNYVRPRHYSNQQYLDRFKELFNLVQLLEFNWGQYEPDEGQPRLEERRNFVTGWCAANGQNRFYGHMLVWTRQYDQYPRTGLPVWLFNYDKDRQYRLLRQRIQREVSAYQDIDILWDVVNEATHCRIWGDWNADNYVQNRQPEPLERIVPYVADALTWAHEANPGASLLINDYRVIVEGDFQRRYRRLIDELVSRKVPLNAVGIQAHEPFKGAYWYAPQELWEAYDFLGAQIGLPIYITEFFQVSDPSQDIRGTYRRGKWSKQLQADAVEEFYRASFGHPSVAAIIYFGLTDGDVVQPACGLLDDCNAPKPAWERLKGLIWDEWITIASGTTAPDGTFTFRGFYGRYAIRVRAAGQTREVKAHLQRDSANHWIIELGQQ